MSFNIEKAKQLETKHKNYYGITSQWEDDFRVSLKTEKVDTFIRYNITYDVLDPNFDSRSYIFYFKNGELYLKQYYIDVMLKPQQEDIQIDGRKVFTDILKIDFVKISQRKSKSINRHHDYHQSLFVETSGVVNGGAKIKDTHKVKEEPEITEAIKNLDNLLLSEFRKSKKISLNRDVHKRFWRPYTWYIR